MRIIILLCYLILIVVGVSFAVMNATPISVNLYFKTISLPTSLLLMFAFFLGLMWGGIFFVLRYVKLKIAYGRLKEKLTLAEQEVKNLRAIPLKD